MKKLLTFFVLLILVFTLSAEEKKRGFFSDRYFEIQTSVPVSLSNNTFALSDIMKRDLVIDLRQIADKMPENGLVGTFNANPMFAMNLRVGKIFVGVSTGVEVYERFSLSKDLFNFIGKGNTLGETIDVSVENSTDVFFDMNLDVGLKIKTDELHVKPTLFAPIISMSGDIVKMSFLNDKEGNVKVGLKTDMALYSSIDFDGNNYVSDVFNGTGFDIGASYRHPLRDKLMLEVDGRIPIVPGRLKNKTSVTYDMEYDMSIMEISDATTKTSDNTEYAAVETKYINRPLKLDAYVEFSPIGYLITLKGGAGFGIYHPFVDGFAFYPEYYIGANLNLANILKVGVSTEYTDRIFKNQLTTSVNLRIIQIDTGLSLEAANFTKSFIGTGYGAFVVFSVGY